MILAVVDIPSVRELVLFGGDDFDVVGLGNGNGSVLRADNPVNLNRVLCGSKAVGIAEGVSGLHSGRRNGDNCRAANCLDVEVEIALGESARVDGVSNLARQHQHIVNGARHCNDKLSVAADSLANLAYLTDKSGQNGVLCGGVGLGYRGRLTELGVTISVDFGDNLGALEFSCDICRRKRKTALVNIERVDAETSASVLTHGHSLVGIGDCAAHIAVVAVVLCETLERHFGHLDFAAAVVDNSRGVVLHPARCRALANLLVKLRLKNLCIFDCVCHKKYFLSKIVLCKIRRSDKICRANFL